MLFSVNGRLFHKRISLAASALCEVQGEVGVSDKTMGMVMVLVITMETTMGMVAMATTMVMVMATIMGMVGTMVTIIAMAMVLEIEDQYLCHMILVQTVIRKDTGGKNVHKH